jgi:hypothetical protein
MTVLCIFAMHDPSVLKKLEDWLTKMKWTTLATWINTNRHRTIGIVYALTAAYTTMPQNKAIMAGITAATAIYTLPAATYALEYIGLVVGVMWFMRTSSPKIRVSIIIFYGVLFSMQVWGMQLLEQ